ncbi:unnamed protein product, partial [Hymenolepis diminuta]
LSKILEFWTDIKSQTDLLTPQLNAQIDLVLSSLSEADLPIKAVLYGIGGLLCFMLIIAVILTILLLYRSFRDHLYENPDELSLGHGIGRSDKCACGRGSACCCSILFAIMVL